MRHGAHRLPTPLARPRASPSASARCALRLRARGRLHRLGRASVLGVGCKGREKSRICLSPAPAGASLRMHPQRACTRACALLVQALSPFGARAREGSWGGYNRRWDRGYLHALVKLAPRAQVKLPSAVKPASQVKFAFFRKNARCATGREVRKQKRWSVHPTLLFIFYLEYPS